jgi:hypothetical protein
MLRLPMPTGIVEGDSTRVTTDVTPVPTAYLSLERTMDIGYAIAFFAGSAALVPFAAMAAPPLAVVFGIGAGLGLGGSFALGVTALMPCVSDEQLHQVFGLSGLFTPALFFAPAGAAIGGREGMQGVLDFGGLAWDVFTLGVTPGQPKPLIELFKDASD